MKITKELAQFMYKKVFEQIPGEEKKEFMKKYIVFCESKIDFYEEIFSQLHKNSDVAEKVFNDEIFNGYDIPIRDSIVNN